MKKQNKLKYYWKKKGFFVINLIRITPMGLPDLICIKPNKVIFCESKEEWDRLSSLQKIWFRRLSKMGFDTYINKDKFTPEVKKTNLF